MRTLMTSALPYANGPLHLGHLAGAYLPADIYARYLRLQGREVLWVCGSDEHGAAITLRAKKEGTTPRAIIDEYHALNKGSFAALGISFDYYHRTSEPLHHATSREFFTELLERGDQFDVKTTEQYYDPKIDQFLADRYIQGTCPNCGNPEAYGDQCEVCGRDLSPTELIDPVSAISGAKPELRETRHWFFRLDEHEEWLKTWIQEGKVEGEQLHDPGDWKKHVIGQCMSWLNDGLHPRSITRDLDWGIEVPDAPGKVLYVWFDAPIGYISSTKQWAEENGGDWEKWWKAEDSRLVHFIGKDNIVFHCIVFPAMLRAHGGYNLPENVPANQFLNFEGDKFSKSKGWGIELQEYVDEFRDFPNSVDALRWALIRNLPEQQDADFTWDGFTEYHDKDLADKLGNFINRVTVLTHKYFDGGVPRVETDGEGVRSILGSIRTAFQQTGEAIEAYRFKDAATAYVELATLGNTYLQDAAPWALYKADPADPMIAEAMFCAAQIAAALAILSEPFVPGASAKLRGVLGLPASKGGDWASFATLLAREESILPAGTKLGKAGVLFPKIDDRKDDSRRAIIQRQRDKLTAALEAKEAEAATTRRAERPPFKPEVTFDDFSKLDLRTATILSAEKIKKSSKLLQLTIDLGNEERSVVSGIAKHYAPEEVVGMQVVAVTNLAPRKMAGVASEAMILMAEDGGGKLAFVSPPEGFGNGWTVR